MDLEPFDKTDPYERMADRFRKQVAEMATKAMTDDDYLSLTPDEQLESFMAGITTGLIGVCFAHIRPGGRDEMIKAIAAYLPQARLQVEGIFKNGRTRR